MLKASNLEVLNKPLFDMIECEASQNYLEFWTRDHFADIIAAKSLDTQLINQAQQSKGALALPNPPSIDQMLMVFESLDRGSKGYLTVSDIVEASKHKESLYSQEELKEAD